MSEKVVTWNVYYNRAVKWGPKRTAQKVRVTQAPKSQARCKATVAAKFSESGKVEIATALRNPIEVDLGRDSNELGRTIALGRLNHNRHQNLLAQRTDDGKWVTTLTENSIQQTQETFDSLGALVLHNIAAVRGKGEPTEIEVVINVSDNR